MATFGTPGLGVSITTKTSPPTRGIPTATDTWFVSAYTDVGSTTAAQEVRDLAQFELKFGTRTAANIPLWDAMDTYFREGGKRAIVGRSLIADPSTGLALFPFTMGPGQVSAIGYVPSAANNNLLWAHAAANNRFAIGDIPDLASVNTASTIAVVNGTTDATDGVGAHFGPWVNIPPQAGVAGAPARKVPASPVIAALCARVDETGNPNQAAAGRWLPLQYVTSMTYDITMPQRVTLLDEGCNMFGNIYGVLENYGFQTLVNQGVDNPFWQANCGRMRMALIAHAQAIGENYMFRTIDGQGILANAFAGQLEAMLLGYFSAGALFGADPVDAYRVDVGGTVNTVTTIAQGKLRAVAQVVLSLHAKAVEIELVTVPVGGQV